MMLSPVFLCVDLDFEKEVFMEKSSMVIQLVCNGMKVSKWYQKCNIWLNYLF